MILWSRLKNIQKCLSNFFFLHGLNATISKGKFPQATVNSTEIRVSKRVHARAGVRVSDG